MTLPGRRVLVPALTCGAGGEELWSAHERDGDMKIGFKKRDKCGASTESREQRQCLHFNR